MKIILILLCLLSIFFFTKNVFHLIFSMENYNIHKKRLKQLEMKSRKETDIKELIETITKPTIKYLFPKFKLDDLDSIQRKLKMAQWDKFFNATTYKALNITLKIIGVILALLLFNVSWIMSVMWGFGFIFGINILLLNSIKNRREKLYMDFPNFLRITEGYLTANLTFLEAVSESIKYVGDEWVPILKQFIVHANIYNIETALQWLKDEVDMPEVKEFVSLVNLTLEQGGNAKDSFNAQADRIREMQESLIEIEVSKREAMSVLIQTPLIVCNLLVVGLPILDSVLNLNTL